MNGINGNIKELLQNSKNIAIVGVSDKSYRASNDIARYLINTGYKIFPVNPNYDRVLGLHCYNSLSEIDDAIDIVNIFRRSSETAPVIDEAIDIKAGAIWMQLGVINEAAAQKALDAGLKVVMNLCIKIEHARIF